MPGGGRFARRHARAYKLMIIESRPPGSALSPWATHRGVNESARHRGRPPVSKGPTSESAVLAVVLFLVLGRADGADSPLQNP